MFPPRDSLGLLLKILKDFFNICKFYIELNNPWKAGKSMDCLNTNIIFLRLLVAMNFHAHVKREQVAQMNLNLYVLV